MSGTLLFIQYFLFIFLVSKLKGIPLLVSCAVDAEFSLQPPAVLYVKLSFFISCDEKHSDLTTNFPQVVFIFSPWSEKG